MAPNYSLEKRILEEFTDEINVIIKEEFDLTEHSNVVITFMSYSKNYTSWGWGNEIISLSIEGIDLLDLNAGANQNEQEPSETGIAYKNKYNTAILASLESNNTITLVKYKVDSKDFYDLLGGIEVVYM
jgi:hypothetical protein